MARRDIVVIGASAGGIQALGRLADQLHWDLPAALCVVQHTSPESPGVLPAILDRRTELRVVTAEDGQPIETGVIYLAPPDRHLRLKSGKLALTRRPRENFARPAIDPLFRSAASSYGPRVIGMILRGMMNDGTASLRAIKKRGGTVLVQDASDALYPEMPRSALDHVAVDYYRPVDGMGDLIGRLVAEPLGEEVMGRSAQTPRAVDMEDDSTGPPEAGDRGKPAPSPAPTVGARSGSAARRAFASTAVRSVTGIRPRRSWLVRAKRSKRPSRWRCARSRSGRRCSGG